VGGWESTQELGRQGRRNNNQKPARKQHKPLSIKEARNKNTTQTNEQHNNDNQPPQKSEST